jgi:hypothetical protein
MVNKGCLQGWSPKGVPQGRSPNGGPPREVTEGCTPTRVPAGWSPIWGRLLPQCSPTVCHPEVFPLGGPASGVPEVWSRIGVPRKRGPSVSKGSPLMGSTKGNPQTDAKERYPRGVL